MTAPRPWSTMPITGAQHDAWMAEERQRQRAVNRADVFFLESQIRGNLGLLKHPVPVCPRCNLTCCCACEQETQ